MVITEVASYEVYSSLARGFAIRGSSIDALLTVGIPFHYISPWNQHSSIIINVLDIL